MSLETFWKSPTDLKFPLLSKEAKEKEFIDGVTDDFNPNELKGLSRRKFLALTAATLAVSTVACTDYHDKGEIIPYNKKPENVIPGIANYYASTCTGCSNHCGILIKTREGRPIKIDGNPDDPITKGKICAIGQASILNLYDPERYRKPRKRNGTNFSDIKWQEAFNELLSKVKLANNTGSEIAIITPKIESPSQKRLFELFLQKYPTTKIYSYDTMTDYPRRRASELCFLTPEPPVADISKAKVIVALESNFLGNEGNFVKNIAQFTENRNIDNPENFNRLYAIEGIMTITGANADIRIPLNPTKLLDLVLSLISDLLNVKQIANGTVYEKVKNYNLEKFAKENNLETKQLKYLLRDLVENYGKAVVIAGDKMPVDLHIAVNILNDLIGARQENNESILIHDFETLLTPLSTLNDFEELIQKVKSGKISVLINFDTNPAFDLSSMEFESLMRKIPFTATMTDSETETALASNLIFPINHNFESWGDYKVSNNTYTTQQPVIEPLYGTYQKEDILLGILNEKLDKNSYHKFVKETWSTQIFPQSNSGVNFNEFWTSVLHDGVYQLPSSKTSFPKINYDAINSITQQSKSGYTLTLKNSYNTANGKYQNNGWLLELPHPISKITWDNYAVVSERTAHKLGLESNKMIQIKANGKLMEIPIFILPGTVDDHFSIEIGFGRRAAGTIGKEVGFDAFPITTLKQMFEGYLMNLEVIPLPNKEYKLATTVEHHSLNDNFTKDLAKKRHIIQDGILADFIAGKEIVEHTHDAKSIVPEIEYNGVKWAMVIDMNKCVGCNACVVACNVENNIPIIGKDQVQRGREMQWIRIDTYYTGNQDNPEVANQPMLCQHCDHAPCENVCPVVATTHSPDGLNQMVYNRCVGTRYCSNNCPYKVRRFNFYDYRDQFANHYQKADSLALMMNPEVTVRSRGVMEKCTFCIQRISEAKASAIAEGRQVRGTDVKTACQEACPASAIKFGSSNEPDSELYYWRNHKLGYHVLEELNVKPNVTYIARLRNKVETKI